DSSFDLVHQKFMVGAFTEVQWEEKVIPELMRLVRSDGWIEISEADAILISDGTVTRRIAKAFHDFLVSKGINPSIGKEIPRIFENSNVFSEIKHQQKTIKLGKKHGESGKESLRFCVSGLNSARGTLATSMNIIPEHYDALLETMYIEAEKCSTDFIQHRICARKI
ncbi:13736_t:CDS:2, partial [Ambispora leptoticha]